MLALACLSHGQRSSKAVKVGSFLVAAQKFRSALNTVLGNPPEQPDKSTAKSGPLTRAFVLAYFEETLDHFLPQFQSHPRPVAFDAAKLKRQNPGASYKSAERLVRWGLVPPFSPLVTSPTDSLTATQLGDALGYFYSQVCYLTHKALPKFTPSLEPTGG